MNHHNDHDPVVTAIDTKFGPDPLTGMQRDEVFFRAMRLFAFILFLYAATQIYAVIVYNGDHFLNVPVMVVSIVSVLALAAVQALLARKAARRRAVDPNADAHDLLVWSIVALLAASLIQVHLVGSLNSLHLMLVLAVLTVTSWLLRPLVVLAFFLAGNAALAALVVLEWRGVLTYAPLMRDGADLGRVFLDWRVVVGTAVNYGLVLAMVAVVMYRVRVNLARRVAEREKLIQDLSDSLGRVKTLEGLLPICSSCKKIRNDEGYWQQLETYFSRHTRLSFSHGLCPECSASLFPDLNENRRE